MKKYFIIFSLTVLSALTFSLTGCDSEELTVAEKQLKLLLNGKPWTLESVTVDGTDETDLYDGLEITFADGTYTSSEGQPVWAANDTWEFADKTATSFERGDGVVVTIQELTATQLVLVLEWDETTIGGGRTASVAGEHVFTFGL